MLSPTTAALLLAALGLVPAVAAHGIVTKVAIGDETYELHVLKVFLLY